MRCQGVLVAAFLALVLAVLPGCNTSGCTDNQSSLPLAGFYDVRGRAVTVDSLEISGIDAPGDSVLYNGRERLSEAYLPLRAQGSSVQYRFYYKNLEQADTLTFDYDAFPYFASEECGAMYRYRLLAFYYTRNFIDSVAVLDSVITNSPQQQLKIYFNVEAKQ